MCFTVAEVCLVMALSDLVVVGFVRVQPFGAIRFLNIRSSSTY